MRVDPDRLRWFARGSAAFMVTGTTVGVVMDLASGGVNGMAFPLLMVLFPVVGFVVIVRRPQTSLGWLMFSMGFVIALPFESYARFALSDRGTWLPGAPLAIALAGPTWIPFIAITGYLLLLFPDGRLPSPRWRWLAWGCGGALAMLGLLILIQPTVGADFRLPEMVNPLGIRPLGPYLGPAIVLAMAAPLLVVSGAVGLILRLRRAADDVERHQLRWLVSAAATVAAMYGIAFFGSDRWNAWFQIVGVSSIVLIPIAIGIAVLRYRLYDIDIVIKKTVVFAVLAIVIGLVYVGLVVGVGAAVSSRVSSVLSAIAAAIVALVFQPVRARARRLADRVVYGRRATPYEVLAEFGEHLADAYAVEDVLPRTARILAEGMGAERASVWLRVGEDMRVVAIWPASAVRERPDDHRVEVRHQGELLGALSVAVPANDPMSPTKEKLIADLASQAGLVLRNVRLTEDLRARLEDLKAAQRRLVSAQDQERRRLERNIHDGAQQQLVALAVQLRLARSLAVRFPAKAEAMLGQLQEVAGQALEDLRDLARGIYPPLLADKGLVAALQAQAGKAAMWVDVRADGIGRYAQEVEAAVYFIVLEALQNVAKYAHAPRASVALVASDGHLRFEVSDDGVGFDPTVTGYGTGLRGMGDRLAALDGELEVRSAPGVGTTVSGRVPVGERAMLTAP